MRSRFSVWILVSLLVLFVSCDGPYPVQPDEMMSSNPQFVLSAEQRASIREAFDPDAVERFLGMLSPTTREQTLPFFLVGTPQAAYVITGVKTDDPRIRQAFDEVWAPVWRRLPAERVLELDRTGAIDSRTAGWKTAVKEAKQRLHRSQ